MLAHTGRPIGEQGPNGRLSASLLTQRRCAKEGGRHTSFGVGYKPQFFFGATNVTGTIEAITGADQVDPGGRAHVRFLLGRPVPLEVGMRFAIREGGRTVGAGSVTSVK